MKRTKAKSIQLRSPATGSVTVVGSVIRNVAILSAGPAKSHGFIVDNVMLRQCVELINKTGRIKCRLTHPDPTKDDLPAVVGYVCNAKLDGSTVRGMLVVLESSPHAAFIKELALEMPTQFGMSISGEATYEVRGGTRYGRLESLNAIDLVGQPAAVANGLLSEIKGTKLMDESQLNELKALLGMDESATADEVLAAVKALLGNAGTDGADDGATALSAAVKAATSAANTERSRIKQLRGLAKAMQLGESVAEGWIDNGVSVAEAGQAAIQLRARMDATTTPTGSYAATARRDVADNKSVLTAGALIQLGRRDIAEKHFKASMPQVMQLNVRNARDLCAASLRMDGRDPMGESDERIIRLSFSTGSMPNALGGALEKIIAESYAEAPQTWRTWCGVKTVKSLRTHTAIRPYLSGSDFVQVGPTGEIKHASFNEETYTYQAATFARMFAITREHFINDDLNVFGELGAELGRQASRTVSDHVYTLLLDNTGDFFGTDNGNYLSGATTEFGWASLNAALVKLRKRRDADNRLIGLVPKVLLVPPEIEATANALVNSATLSRDSTEDLLPEGNPFQGKLTVEVEPRLSDTTFHASASATGWYLLAGPMNPCHVMAFLDGKELPTVESADAPFNQLGTQMRGYIDFAPAQADFRAGVLATGTT